MSRYRIELAGQADDADLRRVLAETPMPGRITVSFRREPSYFAAVSDDGPGCQVVAARDLESQRLVGFGERRVGECYVNGQPRRVGYLSSLRLLPGHRNRGLVARGYRLLRDLHRDGQAQLYLTTIAEGNLTALRILTSGRAGLPAYHAAGCYRTAAIPLSRNRSRNEAGGGSFGQQGITAFLRARKLPSPRSLHTGELSIRQATAEDLPSVLKFLETVGQGRQFFPRYRAADFFGGTGTFQGLTPADILLARRRGQLAGMLAGWDQQPFRQTVVHAYGWPLSWLRPFYNACACWRGLPRLPEPGEAFRYLTAALPLVADDDPHIFASLLNGLYQRAQAGDCDYLLLGLHERDPLLPVLRRYRATWYTTRLHVVCWEDGEEMRQRLDDRPPYLELGCL
jgi:hypothetical protein